MSKISDSLLRKLNELNIDLIFGDINCSGFFFPSQKAIIINEKLLNSNDVNFAIAHELSHFLDNHALYSVLYRSSFSNRSKMEPEADVDAIKILIDIYIEESGIEHEELNSLTFMEQYGIKSSLYDCVSETMLNYG